MKQNDKEILEVIENILVEEQAFLKGANLSDLDGFFERKQAAFEKFKDISEPPSAKVLQRLSHLTKRNQELYEAVRSGLRAGIDRISEIRDATSKLETYGNDGGMETKVMVSPKISLKA